MPKYTYECTNCLYVFTIIHGISETSIVCEKCEKDTLKKQLSKFNLKSDSNRAQTKEEVGSVVKQSIEEFRDDLKEQKKEAKSVSYEPSQ